MKKVVYYSDEINEEHSDKTFKIKKEIDSNYKYSNNNLFYRILSFIVYRLIATPFAFIYCKVFKGIKFKNVKVLKQLKNEGCFIYGNHTNPYSDAFSPHIITFPKKVYTIVHAANLNLPILGQSTKMLGALPVPTKLNGTRNFLSEIEKRCKQGNPILIYPEAHIWPYYTKIRPFTATSFSYPVKLNKPSFVLTTTYQRSNILKKTQIVIYVDGPFYGNPKLTLKNQQHELRDKVYNCMLKRSENNNVEVIKYIKQTESGMINILFCGNSGVFDGIITTLLSIKQHYKGALTVYIYTMDLTSLNSKFTAISEQDVDFVDKILKDWNVNSKAIRVDVTDIYQKEIGGSINENTPYTPYCMLRLLVDKVDNMPNKILYLDTDIMLNANIEQLYNIDVDNYEYAAAKDHYGKKMIRHDYINTGVLLFNLGMIKQTGLLEKARHSIRTKKMSFPDQTAIYINTKKKLMLSQRFNDQKFLKKNTVVRHFSKTLKLMPYPRKINIKPWHITDVHKVLKCYKFDNALYEYIYYKNLYEKSLKTV